MLDTELTTINKNAKQLNCSAKIQVFGNPRAEKFTHNPVDNCLSL